MTKYLLTALAALAALLGALLWVQTGRVEAADAKASAAVERAKAADMALSKEREQTALLRAASLARQQELNRLRQLAEAQKKKLNEALKANPDWARATVPDSVWNALGAAAVAGEAGPRVDRADAKAPASGAR